MRLLNGYCSLNFLVLSLKLLFSGATFENTYQTFSIQVFNFALRGQTVRFVHCKRIPQQTKLRFLEKTAIFLLFSDLLCCFGFHKRILETLYRSKLLQKQANLRNLQLFGRNPEKFVKSTNKK